MNCSQPLQRVPHIFTGEHSKELWRAIHEVNKKEKKKNIGAGYAIRELCYHCQDLEAQVRLLENRIAKLEDR